MLGRRYRAMGFAVTAPLLSSCLLGGGKSSIGMRRIVPSDHVQIGADEAVFGLTADRAFEITFEKVDPETKRPPSHCWGYRFERVPFAAPIEKSLSGPPLELYAAPVGTYRFLAPVNPHQPNPYSLNEGGGYLIQKTYNPKTGRDDLVAWMYFLVTFHPGDRVFLGSFSDGLHPAGSAHDEQLASEIAGSHMELRQAELTRLSNREWLPSPNCPDVNP